MTRQEIQGRFRDFALSLPLLSRVAVIGHSDVDGLAATVITTRIFERLGHAACPYITRKGENAWSTSVLQRIAEQQPTALAVVDLGSRGEVLLPNVPVVLVDHHKPTGVPPGGLLLSGYGEEPTPSSGLVAFWCAQSVGAADGLDWLAAASMLADYGSVSTFPDLAAGAKRLGVTKLRRLTTLLNAPRRTSAGDANPTLQMLMRLRDPQDVFQADNERVLLAAKEEVDAALQRALKIAPRFSGNVALIQIEEGCQVHPMVAQTWQTRLRKNIVICANHGYLPGRVNFAARTALTVNLLEFLQEHKPAGAGEDYGRGHDKATGGSLGPEDWREFLASLGFL